MAIEREDKAIAREGKLDSLIEELEEDRMITLEDFQLTPSEQMVLKSCDKEFRHALWKSGEHICLTSHPDCCRKTAVMMREYQKNLTHSEKNHVSAIDDTIQTQVAERSKKYFTNAG